MPSPNISPTLLTNSPHRFQTLPLILAASLTLTGALLILFTILLYRRLYKTRTAPSDQHYQCRRFSYTQLRRATNSFSDTTKLGHGGFGSVYKADLPNGDSLAVKVMDDKTSGEQGEREFHNELSLSSRLIDSPHIVSLFGFSSSGDKLVLVYEFMPNRSLQDSLLDLKCVELMDWRKRFEIAIDISKGIEFLHHSLVIHGDVKPSNILLDSDFKAKIGDFGLARLKSDDDNNNNDTRILIQEEEDDKEIEKSNVVNLSPEESPVSENCAISVLTETELSPEKGSSKRDWWWKQYGGSRKGIESNDKDTRILIQEEEVKESDSVITVIEKSNVVNLSPEKHCCGESPVSENCAISVLTETELSPETELSAEKGSSKRDWWWKQDGGSRRGIESNKDYVMEWIGSEIKKERANVTVSSSSSKKKKKKRKPREWWKEEFCEELTKKKKKKKKSIDFWFRRDEEEDHKPTKRKKRNSIDWWRDDEQTNQDSSLWCDVNVHKSGGGVSTPSMRGTMCYIAPESVFSEKSDVYSFGVLLLVLVSGRRPLTASSMSEFERANLISWAKQLACNGKLLELVDKSIHSLEKEQAVLCITIALLCLQRSPVKRPTMKEIVQMLEGAAEPPCLPFEFSPSPTY